MALRPAVDSDWAAVTGMQAPGEWFGFVDDGGWIINGMGAIYRATDGRWWITFVRCPGVGKVKTAHASARRLISQANDMGISVSALADPSIDGSEMWVERLGFRRTAETIEGIHVWTL